MKQQGGNRRGPGRREGGGGGEQARGRAFDQRGREQEAREQGRREQGRRESGGRDRREGARSVESPGERVARAFGGGGERRPAQPSRPAQPPRGVESREPPRASADAGRARFDTNQQKAVADDGAHVFGVQPVLEALRAGARPVERLTVAEGAHETRLREILEIARYADIPVRRVPRTELQRLAAGANHQGVVATIAAAHYTHSQDLLDALAARVGTEDPPLAVVLDGVEDPRNLGAVIRTVECAGAHGVFVPERRASGLTETVAKAAAGALEYVPVSRAANVVRLLEELKGRGIWTIGTAAGAETSYADWDWTQPCALLLGGEGEGLRRLVRERCDVLVSIPLRGQIESLNVSVAAGIVLYEAVRQRTARRKEAYKGNEVMSDEW
ncbi:MAG TPA: 23S rRNA (guanosine(2251)-2'-O)-methyltransferase RlmB [Pyrinomonadaceae bacterium]